MALYDCFTFFNEVELLEVRLRLLAPIVDYFVIVEADKTLRGKSKKFNLDINNSIVKKYKDKIRYIQVTDMPAVSGNGQWQLEYHQRNSIIRGLYDCQEEDLILISDIDEIPDPVVLKRLKNNEEVPISHLLPTSTVKGRIYGLMYLFLQSKGLSCFRLHTVNQLLDFIPITFQMKHYYYYMNCQAQSGWNGCIIVKFKNLQIPQRIRDLRGKIPSVDGGWHFSYLGGMERIKEKLRSIVDERPNIIKQMDTLQSSDKYIEDCLAKGLDIYGRKGKEFTYKFVDLEDIGLEDIYEIKAKYPKFFKLQAGGDTYDS